MTHPAITEMLMQARQQDLQRSLRHDSLVSRGRRHRLARLRRASGLRNGARA